MNSPLHRASRRLAEMLVGHPRWIAGILIVSVAAALAAAANLQFDFTPQSIYRGGDNLVAYAEEFRRQFGYDEAVILVVLESTGEGDALDAAALEWQADITERLKSLPLVLKAESLATLRVPRPTLGGIDVRPIVDERPVDEDASLRIRGLLSGQPLVRHGMLSDDDRVAAVPVFLDPGAREIEAMKAVVSEVQRTLDERPPPAGYKVHLTGLPVLRVEVVRDLRSDLAQLMPLAGGVYLIVLWVMYRRVSGALLPLLAVGIGVAWTLATFALSHEALNLVSNVLPVLLVIIGVSSSIQIVSCYGEEAADGTKDRRTAARDAIARIAPACLLAAITTAVGFASLCTAHSVLLRQFGWQAAVGIAYQYVATLITLGAAFAFFAPPQSRRTENGANDLGIRALSGAAVAVARHSWLTIFGAGSIVAGAIALGSRVEINSNAILETFPAGHPSEVKMRLVEDELSGIMPLEVSLRADESRRFFEPDVFHRILAIEQQAREMPGVLAVDSYADVFRQVLLHWPGRRLSETDEQLVPLGTAGNVRLERTARFVRGFADAFHLSDYLSSDDRRARIRLRLREIGSRRTLELIAALEAMLAEAFPPGGPIETRLTGEAYVNARALHTLIRDLYYSLLTASVVIFALIAIEFRSLRTGLIAMLPNLTPLAITLGYMELRGYDLNVGNVILFTICLGLADDNTIHFLYRFREELEPVRRGSPDPAMPPSAGLPAGDTAMPTEDTCDRAGVARSGDRPQQGSGDRPQLGSGDWPRPGSGDRPRPPQMDDVTAAIRRAFLGTGRAIVATSLVLLAGMSVLLVSNFVPTRRFAELTAVTIIGNLLGVLLLLPACLVLFWKRKLKKSAVDNMAVTADHAEF